MYQPREGRPKTRTGLVSRVLYPVDKPKCHNELGREFQEMEADASREMLANT